MALKSFYVQGKFSGRSTPLGGGPKVSSQESSMDLDILQRDNGEPVTVCEVRCSQKKRRLRTEIKIIFPDGSEPQVFKIETRY
jgi:hypothetical protein